MIAGRPSWCALVSALALACGPPAAPVTKPPPPPPQLDAGTPIDATTTIGLALTVTPPDAEVLIDGVSYGKASDLDPVVELKPGLYTLLVSRAGYTSYRVEFSIGEKTESFDVKLEPSTPP